MKYIIFALAMTISTATQAVIEANSFIGNFKVGKCALSDSESAQITYNGQSLIVKFAGQNISTEIFLKSFDEEFASVRVSEESFSITNEYLAKLNEGMLLPVLKTRIARSATGNRVRLSTLYYETNMKSECILYRQN